MKKMRLIAAIVSLPLLLSACIVVPWDDDYGWHHHRGYYDYDGRYDRGGYYERR